ncbi:MAG: winged helix-turn-helix domain-containing protein, partial [Demequinaceae bacterium]|nr:winged helix-turn-helix domain-containing protein [Demequinaceae bacterium]
AERPGLIAQVRAFVNDNGPVTSTQVEHLSPRETKRGTWWDTSHVKDALDLLFITGEVASSRGKNFSRTYDATERAWGLSPASPTPPWALAADVGRQELFDRALAACGIGTPADLCDHFRLPLRPGKNAPDAAGGDAWGASAVERGLAEWVQVEGWPERALLATGTPTPEAPWHRAASDPGRATGAALLSPFDPVCWYRPRLERMFGMEYRIEIYTPAPKRVYGYYCLPFLLGDQMVGRVDLKADRKAGVLRVASAWREERPVAGARRRPDAEVAVALSGELSLMRDWLGLDSVEVEQRGSLAPALADARLQTDAVG